MGTSARWGISYRYRTVTALRTSYLATQSPSTFTSRYLLLRLSSSSRHLRVKTHPSVWPVSIAFSPPTLAITSISNTEHGPFNRLSRSHFNVLPAYNCSHPCMIRRGSANAPSLLLTHSHPTRSGHSNTLTLRS